MNIYCFSTLSFAKLQFKSVINKAFHKHGVASFTDAWIETQQLYRLWPMDRSHLLQMRGLKHTNIFKNNIGAMSHLLQMRGLKRFVRLPLTLDARVASFTDAWIETIRTAMCWRHPPVASFTDAWIETR